MGLKPNPLDLSSFSALTLLVGSFDPQKPVPDMTYNVFGGTLSLTQSINHSRHSTFWLPDSCLPIMRVCFVIHSDNGMQRIDNIPLGHSPEHEPSRIVPGACRRTFSASACLHAVCSSVSSKTAERAFVPARHTYRLCKIIAESKNTVTTV